MRTSAGPIVMRASVSAGPVRLVSVSLSEPGQEQLRIVGPEGVQGGAGQNVRLDVQTSGTVEFVTPTAVKMRRSPKMLRSPN